MDLMNQLPIMGVEHDCILSKQGDITIAFKVELPEVFTLSDEDYEEMHQCLIKAVRLLQPGTVVHKQDWFVQASYQPEQPGQSFLGKAADRHFAGRKYFKHDCYLLLTRKPKERGPSSSMLSGLLRSSIVPPETLDPQVLRSFADLSSQFKRLLEDSKLLKLTRLKAEDLLSSKTNTGLIERYCFLNNQKHYKDIQFGDGVKIGEQQTAIYTLGDASDLPAACGARIDYDPFCTDKTRFPVSFAAGLGLLLPCNHIYNQFLFVDDAQATLKQMEKKRLRLQSLSGYSRSNAIALEATNDFLNEAIGQQRLPVKAHFNVMTWSANSEELKEQQNQVASALAFMDAAAKPETVGAAQLWWAAIPGNAADFPMNDSFDTFAEQGCCFLNLETNYKSVPANQGIRFCDRLNNKPVYVDLFDAPRKAGITSNMGMLIVGSSGGGKSMTANHILRSIYEQGTHCVVVDIGGSYVGLQESVKGYYFSYKEDDPIRFNPFYLPPGQSLDTEKKETLKSLLVSLWKKEHEDFNMVEYVALSDALQGYYQTQPAFACFDSFYAYLKNDYAAVLQTHKVKDKDFDLDNFMYVLRPYYKGGEFDYLLNATENLDLLDQPFIVIELDNIKDHPILFPVVTLLIMEMFVSKMRKLKAVRKALFVDEAWKAIAKSGMAEFLRYAFKTIRKMNGIPCVITQELDDLVSSPIIKDAIINNADIKILMNLKKFINKFGPIQDTLGLSEKAKTILLSVNPDAREICIDIGGQIVQVFRNELCREEYFTFTTEGSERVKVQEYAAKYGSMEKGIAVIIKEEKEGI